MGVINSKSIVKSGTTREIVKVYVDGGTRYTTLDLVSRSSCGFGGDLAKIAAARVLISFIYLYIYRWY